MKEIIFLSIIISFLSCFIKNENVLAFENANVSITPRIIGGEDANLADYPYMASLRRDGSYFCAAFSIQVGEFLSAAHCFTHMPNVIWPYMDITLHTSTDSSFRIGRRYNIRTVTVHPGWVGYGNKIHDIVHFTVHGMVVQDEDHQSVDLATQDPITNLWGFVTGWGVTMRNMPLPPQTLQRLKMWTLIYSDCNRFMPDNLQLEKEHVCAYQQRGHGCADGDSGAPLVVNNQVVGIHAWIVHGRCASGVPEVFVNVYEERDFIALAHQQAY